MVTVIVPLLCPRPLPYRPLPNRRTAWSRTPEFSLSEIAMMRSLTPGAKWKRRFSFLNFGGSRQLPMRSSSRLSLDGNPASPMDGMIHPYA